MIKLTKLTKLCLFWAAIFCAFPAIGEQSASTNVIAVIGGTTIDRRSQGAYLDSNDLIENDGSVVIETSAGKSPTLYKLRYQGVPFYYVRFHGYATANDSLDTNGQNFVRMFAAFHELGVTHIIGGATSGGILENQQQGDLIVSDDFLNFNYERPSSILAAAEIERPGVFPRYNPPFCPDIRKILYEIAADIYPGRVSPTGTVVQDDPSRFETPAEIRMYRTLGGDHVSHNVVTEAIYARQLGMHFAVLDSVSNPAEGVRSFTRGSIRTTGDAIARGAIPVVLKAVVELSQLSPACGTTCIGER